MLNLDTLVLQNVSKNSKFSKSAKIGYVCVTKRVQNEARMINLQTRHATRLSLPVSRQIIFEPIKISCDLSADNSVHAVIVRHSAAVVLEDHFVNFLDLPVGKVCEELA